MNNEDLREAFEIASQRGDDWIDAMNDIFAPDGLTYWDRNFESDADFLLWWLDMATFPSEEFNVLYFLREIAPKVYADGERRYLRAARKHLNGVA